MLNDLEEGSDCPIEGCSGELELNPVEDCSCHINPPCAACMDNPLVCSECDFEEVK